MKTIFSLLIVVLFLACNKDYQCEIYYVDGGKDIVIIDSPPRIENINGLSYFAGGYKKIPNVTRFKILKVIEKNNTNRRRNKSSVPYYGRN